jgi:hypothetical protein
LGLGLGGHEREVRRTGPSAVGHARVRLGALGDELLEAPRDRVRLRARIRIRVRFGAMSCLRHLGIGLGSGLGLGLGSGLGR